MKSTPGRKLARVAYYARNIARDSAPQFLFRRRLDTLLGRLDAYDGTYLGERLNYYNKLAGGIDAGPYQATIATIPMAKSLYYYDLKEHARYFPRHLRLNYRFGDVTRVPARPSFVKSRPIAGDNRNSVLLKLDQFRHFYFPVDHGAFLDKQPLAVWRGGLQNRKRIALIERYRNHPQCDVGHTNGGRLPELRKPFLTPREQMRYRYIISIEGNDVATNLKRILASNSLCLMPAPNYETWFMEGRLVAGKHYVELSDDFDDLEEKIVHYERYPDEALAIIENAHAHVRQFFDAKREQLLSLLVLYKYFVVTGQLDPDPRLDGLIG